MFSMQSIAMASSMMACARMNSGRRTVTSIHLQVRRNLRVSPSPLAGTLRCRIVQVQANVVAAHALMMSRVLRVTSSSCLCQLVNLTQRYEQNGRHHSPTHKLYCHPGLCQKAPGPDGSWVPKASSGESCRCHPPFLVASRLRFSKTGCDALLRDPGSHSCSAQP